jgi:pimeloyl-ACP methyl ester carboxylesterase
MIIDGLFAATGGQPFDPSRPVAVLVHGAGMDHGVWAEQAAALTRCGWSVLAVDLPGHGRSGGEALTSIAAMADRLAKLLAAAGVQAIVAGHSMGALVALDLAARHPERVRAVALIGAAPAMPVHPGLIAAAAEDLPSAVSMITAWGFSTPEPADHIRHLLETSRPGLLCTDLKACDSYAEGEATARRIACPAVVIAGGADRMVPVAKSQELAAVIPGCRVVELDGAGHMLMAERPAEISDALAALIPL